MTITIAARLHPFTHEVGKQFLLPRTSWKVAVFPTRLEFSDLAEKLTSFFLTLDLLGPMQGFTAELDLEKGILRVFGMTARGYVHYHLSASMEGVLLTVDKAPSKEFVCMRSFPSGKFTLSPSEGIVVCAPSLYLKAAPLSEERLSLGMHKAQDWDMIRRRLDCKEIFPHWLRLGSLTPSQEEDLQESRCNFSLLSACKKVIEDKDRKRVIPAFERLFLSAFEGVLVPRFKDTDYQGIAPEETLVPCPALPLLTEGATQIRSLFICERQGHVELLPCLPPEFHSGRMVRVATSTAVLLDMEWSKKALRRVFAASPSGGELSFKLPKGIRSCRLIRGKRKIEKVQVDAQGTVTIPLEPSAKVQLDRFMY
jgi:hypothetical protein